MITIYHNPRCGTSRTVLQTLQAKGLDVNVVEYLQKSWTRDELADLIRDAGLSVREAIRSKESLYQELNLADEGLSDDDLLQAMVAHPILVNRPFVVTERGTRLCRPADVVEEILPD
ncbi:arsenate reductase (glutaredoxin) [Parapusillimonas sp. SGNA-6]|nr:arsenate reductase (glutaredoxin) [Parapusillimonas sp. SGNA-6]